MKKLITITICLVLLSAMVLTVSAAAYMGLTVSGTTLTPGQEFTLSVNLSNTEAVGRGGIVLNYDSAAFRFLGGSCGVSGATLAEVSAGRNGGVFALAENRVVSGTIFTIRMQVREDAPLGSYTISGTASMDIPCSAGSVTVNVTCQHSYSFDALDDAYHRRTCRLCGAYANLTHNWGSPQITQQPTCVTAGTSKTTCADCGQTRQQTIPTGDYHVYSGWTRIDETSHRGSCDLCGKTTTTAHTWDQGTVIEAATCTQTGLTERKCTGCGEVTQQQTPKDSHDFTGHKAVDENSHHQTCAGCGMEQTLPHSFTNAYRHNTNEHYRLCDLCGYQASGQPHTPGPAATYETPQLCTGCNRMLKPAGNHVHSFQNHWTMDEQTHYYACDGCDEQSGLQLHSFAGDCDEACDICGHIRTAPHDLGETLTGTRDGHGYICRICGEMTHLMPHTPGKGATISNPQTCTACGYTLAARLSHPHEFSQVHTEHTHMCVCGETAPVSDTENCPYCAADIRVQLKEFPWWILCICEALAIAALLILPNLKEKTHRK